MPSVRASARVQERDKQNREQSEHLDLPRLSRANPVVQYPQQKRRQFSQKRGRSFLTSTDIHGVGEGQIKWSGVATISRLITIIVANQ